MSKETPPTALTGKMDLALPDGSLVRIQPGPYGKGISVTPLSRAGAEGSGKGRPPRPSTVELRQRLATDKAAGKLRPARDYVQWVLARDPGAPRLGVQQTVYRELRAVGGGARRKGGAGARGRTPHPATVALRDRLAKDKEGGGLKEPSFYVRWLVDKADVGLKQARPLVYRELRAHA